MRRAGWSLRLPVSGRRVARSRARLSSMLTIASHSSLTTASSPGKWAAGLGHFPELVVQAFDLLVVYSSLRSGGLKARNGVKASHACSQTLTA
jgi:hypothetical protein